MQIQISWLLKKPTDLDLHCLLSQGMSCSAREELNIVPAHDKNYNKSCVTSKDSDQPVHPPHRARIFVYPCLDCLGGGGGGAVEGT